MNTIILILGFVVLIKVIYDGFSSIISELKDISFILKNTKEEIEEVRSHTAYFKTFGKF